MPGPMDWRVNLQSNIAGVAKESAAGLSALKSELQAAQARIKTLETAFASLKPADDGRVRGSANCEYTLGSFKRV